MEAPPTAALVVSAPEFLLEFLVVALDAPTQLRKIDQALERDLLGQGGKPILGGLILPFRPLDQKPFFRAWLAQPVIAMRRTYPQAREAGRASIGRALAPPDLSPCVLRQTQRERLDRGRLVLPIAADQLGRPAPARPGLGRRRARAWSPYRRVGQGGMPATYDSPSALIPVRKSVSLPYPASISATPSGRPASTAVRI